MIDTRIQSYYGTAVMSKEGETTKSFYETISPKELCEIVESGTGLTVPTEKLDDFEQNQKGDRSAVNKKIIEYILDRCMEERILNSTVSELNLEQQDILREKLLQLRITDSKKRGQSRIEFSYEAEKDWIPPQIKREENIEISGESSEFDSYSPEDITRFDVTARYKTMQENETVRDYINRMQQAKALIQRKLNGEEIQIDEYGREVKQPELDKHQDNIEEKHGQITINSSTRSALKSGVSTSSVVEVDKQAQKEQMRDSLENDPK